VLPLQDSPRTRLSPTVNLTLIGVNVLVFLYELGLGRDLDPFIERWGVVPARISAALAGAPGATPALITLVTAMFLHGGWLHLGGNMLFLWIFGDNVEDRLGHLRYVLFYLACGVIANLAQVLVAPDSTVPAIGASGAIAGVLGAYVITYPGATVSVVLPLFFLFTIIDVPALIVIGLWFISQFFNGIASLGAPSLEAGGVAWWAHIGGFIAGMVLMTLMPKPVRAPRDLWSVSLERRAKEETGLIGVAMGVVSTISDLVQVVIVLRMIIVFVGYRLMSQLIPLVNDLLIVTTPLVRPFARFVGVLRIGGHPIELYSLLALCAYYLIGAALVWMIAALAYRPSRRYGRRYDPLDFY